MTKLKTFIKWPGNKSKYLKYLVDHVPSDYNRYIEPFLGSGALFLSVRPKKWIINDINTDLIHIWNTVKHDYDHLIHHIDDIMKTILLLDEKQLLTYCRALTSQLNTIPLSAEQSAILLVMKQYVFMGYLYSRNKYYFRSFDMNLYKKPVYFSSTYKANLLHVTEFLQSTKGSILNMDFKKVLHKAKKGDFVFLDPPYLEDRNYNFSYNKDQSINKSFLIDLYNEIQKLDKKGVRWMMTQADTKEIRNLFGKYNISKYKVIRVLRKDNKYPHELLIKNYI